jgi:4-cresol dehydrogenase (hydroxylating)
MQKAIMGELKELNAALDAWRAALPDGSLSSKKADLLRYGRTTYPRGTSPSAIVWPHSTEQVQETVRIARRFGIALYPISRGKNWGYGDACAPTEGAVIVDLSRMTAIEEVNAELGYVVIQPGVTQGQLSEAVQHEAPGFWMDCTGAGPDASIVGNALERGFGHTPYGDHMRSSCGMEVVLANGSILHTGFGHYPKARASKVFPYGVGPVLDGLFTQSNFGIVTRLCVWLYPVPEAFRFFAISLEREEDLLPLIDALRPLRLQGILNSAVHIGNDLRMISSLRSFPWETTTETPLTRDIVLKLRRETGIGAWNVGGSLTGTTGQVRCAAKRLRKAVRSLGKVVFLGDRKLALAKGVLNYLPRVGPLRRWSSQLEAVLPNYSLLKGIPSAAPLLGAQWRVRKPEPMATDPLDTDCGLLWIAPVLPLRGADAKALMTLVTPLFHHHGFDLMATFTLLNERAMVAVLNVAYDKTLAEEAAMAEQCYKVITEAVMEAGYIPYRGSALNMDALHEEDDTFWAVTQAIKNALDPAGIIAPGRYIPKGPSDTSDRS